MTLQSQTHVSKSPLQAEKALPAGTKFYNEDGWIFRERPGSIECVARARDGEAINLAQPYIARHNYPST